MLIPLMYSSGEIVAMDRAYINYEKFKELTERGVTYVTKMKKNLVYEVLTDILGREPEAETEYREENVVFNKNGIRHLARIVTYLDVKKGKKPKPVRLLTDDFGMSAENIVKILVGGIKSAHI